MKSSAIEPHVKASGLLFMVILERHTDARRGTSSYLCHFILQKICLDQTTGGPKSLVP